VNSWIKLIKGNKYAARSLQNIFFLEEKPFESCNMQNGTLKSNYNTENFSASHKAERMFNLQAVSKD